MGEEEAAASVESYKSPTEMFKGKLIQLLFENITHESKSRTNPDEKFAFATKTRSLANLLERYTPRSAKDELHTWYEQMEKEVQEIRESKDLSVTDTKRAERILAIQYEYAQEVHMHNQKIVTNSPIIEIDTEGELDVTDTEIVDVIRRGKRQDDGTLNYKS